MFTNGIMNICRNLKVGMHVAHVAGAAYSKLCFVSYEDVFIIVTSISLYPLYSLTFLILVIGY